MLDEDGYISEMIRDEFNENERLSEERYKVEHLKDDIECLETNRKRLLSVFKYTESIVAVIDKQITQLHKHIQELEK